MMTQADGLVGEVDVMEENGKGIQILMAKLICWGLVAFDILLGGSSMAAPDFVMRIFAPGKQPEGSPLLRRAASIWLFFVPVQVWAAVRTDNPAALRAVAVLRLQEVPADPVWLASGNHFGAFGKFGLVFAPIFNLAAGSFLAYLASRLEKEEKE